MNTSAIMNKLSAIPAMDSIEFLGAGGVALVFHNDIEKAIGSLATQGLEMVGLKDTALSGGLTTRDLLIAVILWALGSAIGGQGAAVLKGLAIGFAVGEVMNFHM